MNFHEDFVIRVSPSDEYYLWHCAAFAREGRRTRTPGA
jgi:hypothetical protein